MHHARWRCGNVDLFINGFIYRLVDHSGRGLPNDSDRCLLIVSAFVVSMIVLIVLDLLVLVAVFIVMIAAMSMTIIVSQCLRAGP